MERKKVRLLKYVQKGTHRRQPRRFLWRMFELAVIYFVFYEGWEIKEFQKEIFRTAALYDDSCERQKVIR